MLYNDGLEVKVLQLIQHLFLCSEMYYPSEQVACGPSILGLTKQVTEFVNH